MEKTFRFSEEFFKNLGPLKPELKTRSRMDRSRFLVALRLVKGESLLDIGTYWGDFLKIARARVKRIYGTEVNQIRSTEANANLGANVVRVDFLHGRLGTFEDESIDTVSCMEVLEHTDDLETAVSEITRVGRKRIIITVPYREKPQYYLCVHCNKPTPAINHLHEFDENIIRDRFAGVGELKMFRFGVGLVYKIPLPLNLQMLLDRLISRLRIKTRWMFVVIDKQAV